MALKVGKVLEVLKDGKWHTLEEVQRMISLKRNQIQQIAEFLERYEFVTVDEARKRMRIEEAVREFLTAGSTS